MTLITRCPICGGKLEATRRVYHSGVELEYDGSILHIETEGTIVDYGDNDLDVYCPNDHTYTQMLAALHNECAECSEPASDCLCNGGERDPDDLDQEDN
jgi:hypothetical protein